MAIDLLQIGQFLKQKREEKGLSVEDVSKALFLRKSLIEAIESGNWDRLPHKIYVRGYVREYGLFLKVSEELAASLVETKQEPPLPVSKPRIPKLHKLSLRMSGTEKSPWKRVPKSVFIYPAIFILAIAFFIVDRTDRGNEVTTPKVENSGGIPANAVGSGKENKIVQDVPEVKRVMITCHERAWVSVVIDGTEKKEFMMSPQEMIMLNGKERFDILVGNAGGVKIFLNGKDTEFTGKNGEVKRIKLS
jgi:cytoskeleton protein RodZ